MVSKNYLLNIVLGFTGTLLFAAVTQILFIKELFPWAIGTLLASLLWVGFFIYRLNTINRKIASFFTAVQNEDTSIRLPDKTNNKVIVDIYLGLKHIVDVFQKMKSENEFREQLFMAMIEHSSTGFISIDEHGDFEIMNQAARNLLDVHYTSNLDRIKEQAPELYQILKQLKPGIVKSCQINTTSNPTLVQVSGSVLSFKQKRLTLVSLQDIKKEVQARELESWQKLIRIMNHEIMNSVAPIISVSKSLLPMYLRNGKPATEADITNQKICDTINGLEVIESMSANLSSFVGHYRELSQIPKPKISEIDIQKWIGTFDTIFKEELNDKNIVFETAISRSLHKLMADEGQLNQVVLNLMKNAMDAPGTKQIKLKAEPIKADKVQLSIWNDGQAIEASLQDKIFVPFFTTKENGAGIGLFISRQIITMHGGELNLMSNDDIGTAFVIEL